MIVYICPKCGGDLQLSVKATYQNERKTPSFSYGECQPPINVTECSSCGWKKEKRDEIERISYKHIESED